MNVRNCFTYFVEVAAFRGAEVEVNLYLEWPIPEIAIMAWSISFSSTRNIYLWSFMLTETHPASWILYGGLVTVRFGSLKDSCNVNTTFGIEHNTIIYQKIFWTPSPRSFRSCRDGGSWPRPGKECILLVDQPTINLFLNYFVTIQGNKLPPSRELQHQALRDRRHL